MSRRIAHKGWGGARKGAGRKAMAASEKKSEVVSFKLTPDELADLEEAAGNTRISAYLRALVLRHLARIRR